MFWQGAALACQNKPASDHGAEHRRRGSTVPGDSLRRRGRYLRGMAWYELGQAQATAINAEAVARGTERSRPTMTAIFWTARTASRHGRNAATRGSRQGCRLGEAEAAVAQNPTEEDIRSGLALNALAGDLADPAIPDVEVAGPCRGRSASEVVDPVARFSLRGLARGTGSPSGMSAQYRRDWAG